ncbi:hypothetical protein T459_15281 [Capsicum annuum]|uniref:MADS-box domain-containing protein n=1 Tax=Capsicum annuum TaxID=4072 RepID=A0A2G2ZJW4_CAPAN|nr:hypothetical protein T459_15281 [Capsicum annuum]
MGLSEKVGSLIKSAKELSTLCNVVVALIIMCPGETTPITWPKETDVQNALTRFESYSDYERSKKLDEHETYLSKKLDEQKRRIKKIERKNKEKIMEIKSNQLFEMGSRYDKLGAKEIKELLKLSRLTRAKLNERKKQFNQQFQTSQPPLLSSNSEQTTQDCLGQNNYFQFGGASTSLVQTTQPLIEDHLGQNNYFQSGSASTSLVQTTQPPTEDYLGQNNYFQIRGTSTSLGQTSQPPLHPYNFESTVENYLCQNNNIQIGDASTSLVDESDSNRWPIEGHDDWSYFFP